MAGFPSRRLLLGKDHSLWDLWRKRREVLEALELGSFTAVRESLRRVRGYCGPHMDNDQEAWSLTVNLLTLTPFTKSSGPVRLGAA